MASASGLGSAWTLQVPASLRPAESTLLPDDGRRLGTESIIGEDLRRLVNPADFQDGGKYRSIVKIQARFFNKTTGKDTWMMGSGWLIQPDILATAGHVVYDHGYRLGAALEIKCYIGYNGRASVDNESVQSRYGKNIVTTAEWIASPDNRLRDLAFIQVDKAFSGNLRLFSFVDTPASASGAILGVVGYPGDKYIQVPGTGEEKGAQMYEQFAESQYDVNMDSRHMISYQISTYGGQSGAPIIRNSGGQLLSIGTHCYGGGGFENNSGNSINGTWGNNYNNFLATFNQSNVFTSPPGKINEVDTRAMGSFLPVPFQQSSFSPYGSTAPATESFGDIFRSIAKVGSVALPAVSGLFGPVGGILGTVGGSLLGAVSGGTESIVAAGGTESTLSADAIAPGAAERAVLAEAALQAVIKMDPESGVAQEILQKMQTTWEANAPNINGLAEKLAPHLTECAMDLAVNRWNNVAALDARQPQSPFLAGRQRMNVTTSESGGDAEGLLDGLLGPVLGLLLPETAAESGATEGAFDWIGSVVSQGIKLGKPLVSQAAKAAATHLVPALLNKLTGTESTISTGSNTAMLNPDATKVILHRALMADTALQAIQSLPRHRLDQVRVLADEHGGETEGIFDSIRTGVQNIGRTALDIGKSAVRKLAPVLLDAAKEKLDGYLSPRSAALAPSAIPIPRPGQSIARKRSIMDLLPASNPVKVSFLRAEPTGNSMPHTDIVALLREREETWVPSSEHRIDWDDNDDLPPVMEMPPSPS